MSIDFSEEMEAPLITTGRTPLDTGEGNLRPQTLRDYTGQEKAKSNLKVYIEAAQAAWARPWTMCCSTVRPAWVKPPWQASLPMRWASTCSSDLRSCH